MKNLSFKFVSLSLLTFLAVSFAAYILNLPFIHITLFSVIFTLFYSEKKVRHRVIYITLALLIYSQFATPLPAAFIFFVSIQLYFLTVSFFESTAFDFSLTALINSILSVIIININRLAYLYVFTGEFRLFSTSVNSLLSAVILILAYNLFKPSIDQLFIKDSWL
ncbi:MAG TPA: hypothetical protein VLJ60_11975 [bacterium]|nr:hypothetical protein [bacterium]